MAASKKKAYLVEVPRDDGGYHNYITQATSPAGAVKCVDLTYKSLEIGTTIQVFELASSDIYVEVDEGPKKFIESTYD